jgi:hypothetical protein
MKLSYILLYLAIVKLSVQVITFKTIKLQKIDDREDILNDFIISIDSDYTILYLFGNKDVPSEIPCVKDINQVSVVSKHIIKTLNFIENNYPFKADKFCVLLYTKDETSPGIQKILFLNESGMLKLDINVIPKPNEEFATSQSWELALHPKDNEKLPALEMLLK